MRGDRIKKGEQYEPISPRLAFDKELSFKARGLYLYLRSKPDDWDFSLKRIADDSPDGVELVQNAMKELLAKRYVTRKRHGDGSVTYTTWKEPHTENPDEAPAQTIHKPHPGNPTVGKPHNGVSRTVIQDRRRTQDRERKQDRGRTGDKSLQSVGEILRNRIKKEDV